MRPCLVLSMLLASFAAQAGETMRIAMGEVDARVEVHADVLSAGDDAEDADFAVVRSGHALVTLENGRLVLDGKPVPGDRVRLRAGTQGIHAGSWDVRGDVVVRAQHGKLQLINVIPLEDYLMAVLGSEMPVSFPLEALKAQAVAARTYALKKKIDSLDAPFNLGSSVLHQVYGGLHREDPRTRAAVEATRGELLTYELAPIEAYFHASCGGRTESGLAALNRDLPYLKSVDCPCGQLAQSHWSLTVPRREMETDFHDTGALEVTSRSSTGRARRVQIGRHNIDAVQFRQRLGYDRVKSLEFDVAPQGRDAFLLSGRGYGHGAGLCQWGAKAYADQGWDYRKILGHYYPGAELQRLY